VTVRSEWVCWNNCSLCVSHRVTNKCAVYGTGRMTSAFGSAIIGT
jgi:hypothetical protein